MISEKKIRLTERMWTKIGAFVLFILMLATVIAGIIAAVFMVSDGIYFTPKEEYKDRLMYNFGESMADDVYTSYMVNSVEGVESFCNYYGVGYASVINDTTGEAVCNVGRADAEGLRTNDIIIAQRDDLYREKFTRGDTLKITVILSSEIRKGSELYFINLIIELAYALRYWIYAIIFAAIVIAVICFVFLMCASGHRAGIEGISEGWGTRIPFDLLVFGFVFAIVLYFENVFYSGYGLSDIFEMILFVVFCLLAVICFVGLCMSFALRMKLGGWWKNTVVYFAAVLLWRILKCICRKAGELFKLTAKMLQRLPLIWKSSLMIAAITGIEFVFLCFNIWEGDNILVFWTLEKLILIPASIYVALCLRKLKNSAAAIAKGDLISGVDTKYMIADLKAHGEDLNSIGNGLNTAVEQRLRSERMKTELITNVSHDIKTPLTSIINYSDLISRENCDNEKIKEYSCVLLRQSERLKRLIDDLVEASKASTGNLDMNMEPFDMGVLVAQAAGEYGEKLSERGLTLVLRQTDENVRVMADSRRMWRVFDNLMNNILKYAQSGTRVYINLESAGGTVTVTFKNTSREELNMSVDELMERFTRGDASRNTEGNGLGISIAKSLTELQNGTFELTVDGDLFKVAVHFPAL